MEQTYCSNAEQRIEDNGEQTVFICGCCLGLAHGFTDPAVLTHQLSPKLRNVFSY